MSSSLRGIFTKPNHHRGDAGRPSEEVKSFDPAATSAMRSPRTTTPVRIAVVAFLFVVVVVALSSQASAATSSHRRSATRRPIHAGDAKEVIPKTDESENAARRDDETAGDLDENDNAAAGVVRMDLNPGSSYARWLQRRLEALDERIEENGSDGSDDEEGGGRMLRSTDGGGGGGADDASSNRRRERELIRRQLEEAERSLRGAGAAYASVMEFPTISIRSPDDRGGGAGEGGGGDLRRHLKESSQKMLEHNEGIREYNENYRRYSRYEWAAREGRGGEEGSLVEDGDDGGAGRQAAEIAAVESPLVGTSWKAVEIAFNASNATDLTTIPSDDHPITLSFDSARIHGSGGCNRYHGSVTLSLDAFNTSAVGGTRMMCHSPEAIMEREGMFLHFISGARFFYEVVDDGETAGMARGLDGEQRVEEQAGDAIGEGGRQLVLMESVTRSKDRSVPGEAVARFVPHSESAKRASGDRRAMMSAVDPVIANTNDSFRGSSWSALDYRDGGGALSNLLPDSTITLTVEEGSISGHTDCNSYSGDVADFTDTTFRLAGDLAVTERACADGGRNAQERAFLRNFRRGSVVEYELSDDGTSLRLIDGNSRATIARFAPRRLVTPIGTASHGSVFRGEGRDEIPFWEAAPRASGDRGAMTFAVDPMGTTDTAAIGDGDDVYNNIVGSSWLALDYRDGDLLSNLLPGSAITLTIGEDSISGHTDCNSYSGDVADLTSASLRVDNLLATERACADPGLNLQEGAYLHNFRGGAVIGYEISDDGTSLRLQDGDSGAAIAHFAPRPLGAQQITARHRDSHFGGGREDPTAVGRHSHLSQPEEFTQSTTKESAFLADVAAGRRELQPSTARAKKKGGLYNAYQTSPLHQGYGTHYATIWVGTPSQRKSVIVDTGSHFTAFPCKGCEGCGEEHHTDKYFDPEASTTFRALGCDECRDSVCEEGRCVFSQTYTEGSSWHAYESVDKVFVGARQLSSALNPINNAFKTDFLFGCQVEETGLFVTQLADGIMGMSAHPSTLPRAMYEQGRIEHDMFSMCFRRELHVSKQGIVAGMLTLGGIDSRRDFAPMVYARNVARSGWFTVFVKNVFIREKGGQSAMADGPHQTLEKIQVDLYRMNSGKGVIMDSGTTDTYLHESIAGPFERVWKRVTGGRTYSNSPVKMDEKDLLLLPTVLIQMAAYDDAAGARGDSEKFPGLAGPEVDPSSPNDVLLAIPATHYMEFSPSKGTYTPRIYFTESAGGVIGANAMQGHNVLFDWENQRVGFAESSCEYMEESKQVTDDGNVVSVDCRLGAPSLSVSCSDSADLSRCETTDPNGKVDTTALDGLEIWTRVVQAPGTPHGMTCEEVSNEQNEANGGGPMEVNCDGKGVCREVRKCVISCANAIAHGTVGKAPDALAPIGSCGAASWSACDHACTQTKVDSVMMNDGKCHEKKADGEVEVTRPCHVQACGRSDPCRVPFVVHAILKVRGAVASRWDKHAEEIFAEAFSEAMNDRLRPNVRLCQPGDVIVLNASPWRASDDTIFGTSSLENGEDEELGMQLVVETSLFNPNAELQPPSLLNRKGRKEVPLATCHERDLQPLADKARNIHKKLAQDNFIHLLVQRMKKNDALGESQSSPFYYTFEDRKLTKNSRVVTSWTIKTDIGTGSSRIDFNSFTTGDLTMDLLLLGSLIVLIAYLCWSLRLCSCGKRSGGGATSAANGLSPRERRKRAQFYSRVESNGRYHDDDTVMAVTDEGAYYDERSVHSGMTEMTPISERDESSQASIGSLSVYLKKTSGHAPGLM